MSAANWGRIINIASVHGLVASAQKSAYVAAKHGIVGLTKAIALETATTGVTCNAICPGWVLTPLVQKQIDDRAAREGIRGDAGAERAAGRKAAVAAVHHAGGTGRTGRVPVLAGRRPACAAWPGTWTAAGRRSSARSAQLHRAGDVDHHVGLAGLDRHRRVGRGGCRSRPPSPSRAAIGPPVAGVDRNLAQRVAGEAEALGQFGRPSA